MSNTTSTPSESTTKACTKCGEVKSLSEYNKSGKNVDGSPRFRPACKGCRSAQLKVSRERGKANQRLTHLFDCPDQDSVIPSMRSAIYSCTCFNFHRARKDSVKGGDTSSCGCTKREVISAANSRDLSHFQAMANGNANTSSLIVTGKEVRGNETYLEIKCSEHDWSGWQQSSSLSEGSNPCPDCQVTGIMASLIALTLRKSGIPFTQEATNNDLLAYRKDMGLAGNSSAKCRFDFEVKGWGYIECDDESHEMAMYGETVLSRTQAYDKAKDDFCGINGIRLERITWRQQRWNAKERRAIERHVDNDIDHDGFIDFETALDSGDRYSCILLITLSQLVHRIQDDLGLQVRCSFPSVDEVYENARKVRVKKGLEKYEPDTTGYGGGVSTIINTETGQMAFAESIAGEADGYTKPFGNLPASVPMPLLNETLPPATQPTFF